MNRNKNIIIVMPAYNAAKTVKDTFLEIPLSLRKNVILVDDKSTDRTVLVARKLGIKTFTHTQNLGYGGNQKTCYWEALKYNPKIVVMLHPDYQYDAKRIQDLVKPILNGEYDFMFGSRMMEKQNALQGGMPKVKFYINALMTKIENRLLGVNLSEHFSGLRAYSTTVLTTVPYQKFSHDFVFDQQMEASSLSYGFRIGEIPIPTRYHEKASSIKFLKGVKFLLETFLTLFHFKLHKWGIWKSHLFSEASYHPFFSVHIEFFKKIQIN